MKINSRIVSENESIAAFYEALHFRTESRVSMGN